MMHIGTPLLSFQLRRTHSPISLIGLIILASVLLVSCAKLFAFVKISVFYPYQLDYGEGIVWQQMRDIMHGTAYGPLGVYPAIVYHYPPVYHLVSGMLSGVTGMDELATGRFVSFFSTLISAWLVGWLSMQAIDPVISRRARAWCGVFAALLFLSCYPVMMWSSLMRVDMLAGMLSLLGIALTARAMRESNWIYAASIAFVLSIFTKQISVAAPAAVFATLLVFRTRLAIHGLIAALTLGLLLLGGLTYVTGGEFLRHIFLYNINRFDFKFLANSLFPIIFHVSYILLAIIGAVASGKVVLRGLVDRQNFSTVRKNIANNDFAILVIILLAFLAIKTIMLIGMMKSGSSYNYMIEWLSAVAIFAGIPLQAFMISDRDTALRPPPILYVTAFIWLPIQVAFMPFRHETADSIAEQTRLRNPIVQQIAHSRKPVISDDMTLLIRAGKDVKWESAITAELGHLGLYNQTNFARLVRSKHFGFFITEGRAGSVPFDERYNPVVAEAIQASYPYEKTVGNWIMHFPSR